MFPIPSAPSAVGNPYSHMIRPTFPMPRAQAPIVDGYHRGEQVPVRFNIPTRYELFILGDGEKKVTEEIDTRIPSASIFTFNKEDHTLGNLIRSQLFHSEHILFSGYKVPHPLESKFILRIQTDGTLTPRAALIQACKELVHDYALLNQEFTKEWELRKMVGAETNGVGAGGPGTDGQAGPAGLAE